MVEFVLSGYGPHHILEFAHPVSLMGLEKSIGLGVIVDPHGLHSPPTTMRADAGQRCCNNQKVAITPAHLLDEALQ